MPSPFSPQWRDRTSGFFSSSGEKLKEAGKTAGTFVGGIAKDTKGNVAEVAGRVGSVVKSRWAILQQPSTRLAVQERLVETAASTGSLFRKGISETKDKVVVGKTKVEEVAKITAQKSKTVLTDIERWQKGVASTDVFGVPIEVTVKQQQAIIGGSVPCILVKCADYLVISGLSSPDLFKSEGNKKVTQQLISLYNSDSNASLPEGTDPLDAAALVKYYLASLPQPLTTTELYDEIKSARSSIPATRNILKKLPTVNYMTLEYVTALLLQVSQKSFLNKMDARSLAMEMAPLIMWPNERKPELYQQFCSNGAVKEQKKDSEKPLAFSAWDMLEEEDESVDHIPLDDGVQIDYGAVEVVQCLIEHHNTIFTDANETAWR